MRLGRRYPEMRYKLGDVVTGIQLKLTKESLQAIARPTVVSGSGDPELGQEPLCVIECQFLLHLTISFP